MTKRITQMEINQELIADLASKVGENQGRIGAIEDRLEAIDNRVAHNCQRNEDNFKLMENKLDSLSQQIIGFFAGQQGRVDTLQTEFKAQNDLVHKIQNEGTRKSVILSCISIVSALAFIFGSIFDWGFIGQFFNKTTARERIHIAKDIINDVKPISTVELDSGKQN